MKTIPVCEDCASPSSAIAVVVSGWKRQYGTYTVCTVTVLACFSLSQSGFMCVVFISVQIDCLS